MIDTLKLKGNQYNLILSIFFIPYVLTSPFLGILGKKYGPNIVLPSMMFTFGLCTILVVAVFNFSGLLAIRWFLGMAESAFFPLVIYYQTTYVCPSLLYTWYHGNTDGNVDFTVVESSPVVSPSSMRRKASLLHFQVFLLLGYFKSRQDRSQHGDTYSSLKEEVTVLCALFALWYLPRSASEAKFLSPEEKELAYLRLQLDSSSVVNEEFDIRDALRVFKEPTSWAILAIEICLGVPLQSVQLFLPEIISRLGYGTVKTNLYTVAPNVSGAIVLLVLAFGSDWTRWRYPFIALGFLFTFIGFVIYSAIDVESDLAVAYFASFVMTW